MSEATTIETQLLVRALASPYVAKSILGAGVPVLLKNQEDLEIGYALVRYYATTKELITESSLNHLLEEKFKLRNAKLEREKQPTMTESEVNSYFSRVGSLFNTEIDTNRKLEESIDTYIHDELTTNMIAREVQKGLDNLSYRVKKEIDKINDLNIGASSIESVDFFDDEGKRADYYEEFGKDKVPFSIPPFDKITRNGLERGQIALFNASSGTGKTMLLSNFSYYFAIKSKKNVLHITLEEKVADQLLRLDRLTLNLGIEDVFNVNGKINDTFVDKASRFYPKVSDTSHGKLRIIKSNPDTVTLDMLRQLIMSYNRKDSVHYDVVILDYADLLKKPSGSMGHEAESGEKLFQNLSKIAQETNCVIITGSQLNRTSGGSDIKTIYNVEGSLRKINSTVLVGTINTTPEEYDKGFFRIYLDKCRNNFGYPDKMLYMKYDLHSMRLHEDNELELNNHKALIGNKRELPSVEKQDNKQNMIDAINASLG